MNIATNYENLIEAIETENVHDQRVNLNMTWWAQPASEDCGTSACIFGFIRMMQNDSGVPVDKAAAAILDEFPGGSNYRDGNARRASKEGGKFLNLSQEAARELFLSPLLARQTPEMERSVVLAVLKELAPIAAKGSEPIGLHTVHQVIYEALNKALDELDKALTKN